MSELNDPRVFFAAERTLLAWQRTSLTLMAFGFMIERFGLLLQVVSPESGRGPERGLSFWVGIAFILLGSLTSVIAVAQFRKVLRTLKPVEVPHGYRVNPGVFVNLMVALLGALLSAYLFYGASL